jgi:hypothetical protein
MNVPRLSPPSPPGGLLTMEQRIARLMREIKAVLVEAGSRGLVCYNNGTAIRDMVGWP